MNKEDEQGREYGDIVSHIERSAVENKTKSVLETIYELTTDFGKFYSAGNHARAIGQLSLIDRLHSNYSGLLEQFTAYQTNPGEVAPVPYTVLDKRLEELDFSQRTFNCLRRAHLLTLRDISNSTEGDLIPGIRGFGKLSFQEVRNTLAEYGLKLREPEQK